MEEQWQKEITTTFAVETLANDWLHFALSVYYKTMGPRTNIRQVSIYTRDGEFAKLADLTDGLSTRNGLIEVITNLLLWQPNDVI